MQRWKTGVPCGLRLPSVISVFSTSRMNFTVAAITLRGCLRRRLKYDGFVFSFRAGLPSSPIAALSSLSLSLFFHFNVAAITLRGCLRRRLKYDGLCFLFPRGPAVLSDRGSQLFEHLAVFPVAFFEAGNRESVVPPAEVRQTRRCSDARTRTFHAFSRAMRASSEARTQ